MEKSLYELKINEALEHVMPPLQEMELELLTQSLLTEGCRDSLVIWKETGDLVDGHNRYRICQENNIPFKYIEMSFEDETAAKHWIIKNQLSRRNVPPFVRCELVLPLEEELKAEAKKRQIRKPADSVVPTLALQNNGKTRDELAQMAGVSHGTMDKAKKLMAEADEETKEKLRSGDLTIHRAYTALEENSGRNKITRLPGCGKNDPFPTPKKNPGDLVPGFGIHEILENSRLKTGYMSPPDDVVAAFEEAEERRKKLWENADMAIIEGEMRSAMEYFVARVGDITSMMKPGLRTSENIEKLKAILMDTVDQITEIIDSAKKGE